MVNQARIVMAASKTFTTENKVTMQGLWRLAAWGAVAACALLIAVFATRGETDWRRLNVLASLPQMSPSVVPAGQASAPPANAQIETRRLADAVRGLAAEDDELRARVAVVEHTMDDVTGSITQQIAAVKSVSPAPAPWPDNQPALPLAPADVAAALTPVMPMPMPTEYGVDIGSALSIPTLRARWAGLRSAHPNLFDGLEPVAAMKRVGRSKRIELRLVAGPLPTAEAASHLCAELTPYRLYCQPTPFSGEHLSLE
jgi:hypothetical protein